MAGHFWKNGEITRKIGLSTNIKGLYYKGIDVNNFFPRCYDLSEKHDYEDFIEDFKTNKAISILKKCLIDPIPENITFLKVKTAIQILERKINVIIGNINWNKLPNNILISQKEWNIIGEENPREFELNMEKLKKRKQYVFAFQSDEEKESKETEASTKRSKSVMQKKRVQLTAMSQKIFNIQSKNKESTTEESITNLVPIIESLLDKIKECSKNQYEMNGDNNIWIMKPSGLSRGRGISCVSTLAEVINSLISSSSCIIQKYIENPLLIKGRKFDIRQWVLVTDLEPLTIWLFDTPYLRFSAETYDVNNIHNRYSHLTNNSVNKHCIHFKNDIIPGNMWEIETFKNYLAVKFGNEADHWQNIQEKIKRIVILSLLSVKHKICHRKNSHEIFGYDIMIDENLNCYLIEVNSSPAWDYSTEITKKLVKEATEDLVKVVVDYEFASQKNKKDIDTGKFKIIFKE